MKLSYGRHMGKRKLKKLLGSAIVRKLTTIPVPKVGDLITTCAGYNERIKSCVPAIHSRRNRRVICDYLIVTERDTYHSLYNCCVFPAASKAEIEQNWLRWSLEEDVDKVHMGEQSWAALAEAVRNGAPLLTEDGCPTSYFLEKRYQ